MIEQSTTMRLTSKTLLGSKLESKLFNMWLIPITWMPISSGAPIRSWSSVSFHYSFGTSLSVEANYVPDTQAESMPHTACRCSWTQQDPPRQSALLRALRYSYARRARRAACVHRCLMEV